MALDRIHLRKLLLILFLPANKRRSAIRRDVREENARAAGARSSGGDFYGDFWADAKSHVFGLGDLHTLVDARIAANARRRNLYPRLRDGFLLWWNERRRWTNEPFHPGPHLKAQFTFPEFEATVKVDRVLSVRDGLGVEHAIYPYFAPEPILSAEAGRLGLWLLIQALPIVPADEIRILDVIQGQTFSIDRYPLHGDEEVIFRRLYEQLLREWEALREADD
ncbi:hypothetical protein [Azospirillum sp. B4]|uniref:hypothetical protein n=1 Tax=Azospirillum sp. B4 TaxID=95605 RepID=UPI0009FDF8F6|nr:hypothetical protein [Azospirillum sp. B4]